MDVCAARFHRRPPVGLSMDAGAPGRGPVVPRAAVGEVGRQQSLKAEGSMIERLSEETEDSG